MKRLLFRPRPGQSLPFFGPRSYLSDIGHKADFFDRLRPHLEKGAAFGFYRAMIRCPICPMIKCMFDFFPAAWRNIDIMWVYLWKI